MRRAALTLATVTIAWAVVAPGAAADSSDAQVRATVLSGSQGWSAAGMAGAPPDSNLACFDAKDYRLRMCGRVWYPARQPLAPSIVYVSDAGSPSAARRALAKAAALGGSDMIASTPRRVTSVSELGDVDNTVMAGVTVIRGSLFVQAACTGPKSRQNAVLTCARELADAQGSRSARLA
jgi:hypothetical protein